MRDSDGKISPNRYISGATDTSNQFDILGLLSDDDVGLGDRQINMDV